ncbi:ceramide glucosyltransferase [Fuscovulum ytuae]|uniref:Ceramide glucosyltransferase n=1 Tax=Fuscovulum ytuae TaxID=3042299 RepID=A0ABY8Q5J6_9RHOB|nr:ceramide glucosyltransferase [Fuscovulum sp. YMD61]WGV15552.1 ceramide glucosyltransferase [Fuscovulum sp. YMD61]
MMEALLGVFVVAMAAMHLLSCLLVARRKGRVDGAVDRTVFVTLLRPVCGVDRFDETTLETSFHLHWPRYEVIFCAGHEDDPAIPLVRALIARNPNIPARLLIGEDRVSGNPKLNNLVKGWRAAAGDRVVMADSNLLLPPDYIDRLMAVDAADVGLVTSPPIGTMAEGFWGALEIAFLNGNQARLQLAADELGHGFAQGKTLMWAPAFLDAHGGLRALGRNLAEDVAATKLVRNAGRHVRLTHLPFAQPIGRRDLRTVWGRQLRWSKVRRDGFAALFLAEPLNGALFPVLAATVAVGPWGGAVVATLFYGSELIFCRVMGWPVRPLSLLAMVLRDAMIPVLWLATFRGRGIVWRGTTMAPPQTADQTG